MLCKQYYTLLKNITFITTFRYCVERYDKYGSFLGGFLGCIISQPFDYYKTIIQSDMKYNRKNMMNGLLIRSIGSSFEVGVGYLTYITMMKLLTSSNFTIKNS